MAIERYGGSASGGLVAQLYDLGMALRLRGATARQWLLHAAPVLIRARIVKLGWDGIGRIPFIHASTRSMLQRLLLDGVLG